MILYKKSIPYTLYWGGVMVSGVPQEVAVDFWNKINALGRDDYDSLLSINRRIWPLSKKFPRRAEIRLVAALGLLRAGEREAAIDHINAAFELRFVLSEQELRSLIHLLYYVGDFERGCDFSRTLLVEEKYRSSNEVMTAILGMACIAGDISLIGQIYEKKTACSEVAKEIADELMRVGILNFFAGHQNLVCSILRPYMTVVEFGIIRDGIDGYMFVYRYFTTLNKQERFKKLKEVNSALHDYYIARQMDGGCYLGIFQTIISGIDIGPIEEADIEVFR